MRKREEQLEMNYNKAQRRLYNEEFTRLKKAVAARLFTDEGLSRAFPAVSGTLLREASSRHAHFTLLSALGKTNCWRCSLPMTVETYSLDHKQPWLDEDVSLFWDPDNIGYSHKSCNSREARKPTKKNLRDEDRWCYKCQMFLPYEHWPPSKRLRADFCCRACATKERMAQKNKTTLPRAR